MPFDGAGNYTLPTPASPAVSGAVISAAYRNTIDDDIKNALSLCLTRDGQSPPTANLPMGGYKLTGLAAGAADGQSLRFEQLYGAGQPATPAAARTNLAAAGSGLATASGLTMSTDRVLGRMTASTGAIEELDVDALTTFLNPSFEAVLTPFAGMIAPFALASAPSGWVKANGGTIGSAASGATRANADTQTLFNLLWADFADAILPIQTSAGAASTRGASAAADWDAGKRLVLPDMRGEFLRGYDDGRGVDASRVQGSSQTQSFVDHSHAQDLSSAVSIGLAGGGLVYNVASATGGLTGGANTGGGSETRPRNVAWLYCIKL